MIATVTAAAPDLEARLRRAWDASDALFALLPEHALLDRPIALRHPFLFYVGHLPAFLWNQLGRGVLGWASMHPDFDQLFERGIDPAGAQDNAPDRAWPPLDEVLAYRDAVRARVPDAVLTLQELPEDDPLVAGARVLALVLEHELMHHETLLYMLQQQPLRRKRRPAELPPHDTRPAPGPQLVEIPAGPAVLGARFHEGFGWDNEFPEHAVGVPAFRVERTPVTNGDWLAFVEDGGAVDERFWSAEDLEWAVRTERTHPVNWIRDAGGWCLRTMFDDVALDDARGWPVQVSLAEARAYCRWRGAQLGRTVRLMREAEFQRAAYHDAAGPRPWPWGEAPPTAERGNFGGARWSPAPAGTHPAGDSAWGVADLVGDGWEWTATPFAPFPGYAAWHRTYPGYSRDFFDGRHFVMRGASWATPVGLIRPSFRNWFQAHYPYVFAKFRCVVE